MMHMLNVTFEHLNAVNVAFDSNQCMIHLLEANNDENSPVSSAITDVLQHISERVALLHECSDSRWFLYDINGGVNEIKDGQFIEIDLHHRDLYEPFIK